MILPLILAVVTAATPVPGPRFPGPAPSPVAVVTPQPCQGILDRAGLHYKPVNNETLARFFKVTLDGRNPSSAVPSTAQLAMARADFDLCFPTTQQRKP